MNEQWDYVDDDFFEGHILVSNGDKCGMVDETGRLLVPCRWNWMNRWEDGTAEFGNDLEIYRMDQDGSITQQPLPDYWSKK